MMCGMQTSSQLPFMLLFDNKKLNICFAWLLSLLIIYGIDKKNYRVLILGLAAAVLILLTIYVLSIMTFIVVTHSGNMSRRRLSFNLYNEVNTIYPDS